MVLFPRFLEEQGLFLLQVREDERGTLGDVCAALRDNEGRVRSRSVYSEGSGSAAHEPERSSSHPKAGTPTPAGVTDLLHGDCRVACTPPPPPRVFSTAGLVERELPGR